MAAVLARPDQLGKYTTFGDSEDDTPGGMLVGDSLVLDDDDAVFYSPPPPTTPGNSALAAATRAARENAGENTRGSPSGVEEINLAGTPPRAKEGYPSVEALADAASRAESAHSQVAIGTRPWNPQYRSQQVGNSASPVHRSRTDSTSSVMSTSDAGPPPGWSRGRRTSWIDESFDQDEVSDIPV